MGTTVHTVIKQQVVRAGQQGPSGAVSPISDNVELIKNQIDDTKKVRFDASLISSGQTRVVKVPDFDVDLALVEPLVGLYYCNPNEADQGAAGNGHSLYDLVAAIGSTEKRHIYFRPGVYTLTTSLVIPGNIALDFSPGAFVDGSGTLTINGPISANGLAIFGSSITALISNNVVNVKWFGATGDGATDDTAAMQSALDCSAKNIFIPTGTYLLNKITIPNTVHSLVGNGSPNTTIVCSGSITNYDPWLYFNSISGLVVSGFSVSQNKTTYALNHLMNFGSCSYVVVKDIIISESGFFGIYMAGCTDINIEKITVTGNYGNSAISAESASNKIKIRHCSILGNGTGHAISIDGGSQHEISNNFVNRAGATTFCIAVGADDTIVSENRLITNTLEGINAQDCSRVTIANNIVYCESGHADFGISLYAAVSAVQYCLVTGNRIFNSGSSGIGLASTDTASAYCRYNTVIGNAIYNPCHNAGAIPSLGKGGINLYGVNTSANTIQANSIFDESSNILYGVNEWDDGTGAPTYNEMIHNRVPVAGALIEAAHRLGTTTNIWDLSDRTFTPTISASSGTITTSSSAGTYRIEGKKCIFYMRLTVTTNGTGSGQLIATLPVASISKGVASGKEVVTTGYAVIGEIQANTISIVTYNNLYPVSSGSVIKISGEYEIP